MYGFSKITKLFISKERKETISLCHCLMLKYIYKGKKYFKCHLNFIYLIFLNHLFQFDEGLSIIKKLLQSTVLEKKFKSVKMLYIEVLLLQSEYLSLSVKLFTVPDNVKHIKFNSHLSSIMDALSLCKTLLKHVSEKLSSGGDGFGMYFSLFINTFKCHSY